MHAVSRTVRCGVLCGLALLCSLQVTADELLRDAVRNQLADENYLLIEDSDGARLFVFSKGSIRSVAPAVPENETDKALAMTRSANPRERVRGLTLLSDVDDPAALDAALVLLSDPEAAVREEAVQLLIEHPAADIDAVVALVANDPAERVRLITAELLEERQEEMGD